MTEGERNLFVRLIAQVGKDWEEQFSAELIRMDESKLELLLDVSKYLANPSAVLESELVQTQAPEFCSVFHSVTLRKIEERTSDGPPDD